jgi:hypothetical protein
VPVFLATDYGGFSWQLVTVEGEVQIWFLRISIVVKWEVVMKGILFLRI